MFDTVFAALRWIVATLLVDEFARAVGRRLTKKFLPSKWEHTLAAHTVIGYTTVIALAIGVVIIIRIFIGES